MIYRTITTNGIDEYSENLEQALTLVPIFIHKPPAIVTAWRFAIVEEPNSKYKGKILGRTIAKHPYEFRWYGMPNGDRIEIYRSNSKQTLELISNPYVASSKTKAINRKRDRNK